MESSSDSVNSASVPVADVQRENSEDCDCDKKDGLKQDDTLKTSTDNNILTIAEEVLYMTEIPELEDAVEKCKIMVNERPDDSEDKKMLIRRLIELRLRLHDVKEALKENASVEIALRDKSIVLGHHFIRQSHPKSLTTYYCDRCSGVIWNAIHAWHLCSDCDYKCHTWCLNQVCRVCAYVTVTEKKSFELEICPEAAEGLAAQNYRCAECLNRTSHRVSVLEPRRCDYDGKYYCPTCHWNSTAVIPARVINNWDFSVRRVCRASNQKLRLLSKFPIISLEKLNPVLFASVDELKAVKHERQRILLMKKYITSCKTAVEANLTWQLRDRLHFLENDDRYSLQDLIDLKAGNLLTDIQPAVQSFVKHITKDCQVCIGKGFFCEYCKDKVVAIIYPFEPDVLCCPTCGSAFHVACWLQNMQSCLKCARKQKRLSHQVNEVL